MITKVTAWLSWVYCHHVQKFLATIVGALAVVDLTPYAEDFHAIIPWKGWHPLLRLVAAGAIFWRAMQSRRPDDSV